MPAAADPEVRGPAQQHTRDAPRQVIEYFLYRDLERGWRVTAPNLEDCGLLRFEYEGLGGEEGLLGETELWESGFSVQEGRGSRRFVEAPAALRLAPAEAREEILRTLLDVLRRALAVKVDVLDPRKQHDLVERTKPRLLEGTVWYLDEERFREGDLPLLFCSPTMELGVDVAQLNLVNLRNVPPTPANYAQRSGRAADSPP